MKICHSCRNELKVGRSIGRRDVCPRCGADLRCCLNCRLFDRASSKQCREPVAELVKDKGRANFCDYFSLLEGVSADSPQTSEAQARKALEDLFKK